jgi:hypothetical protein
MNWHKRVILNIHRSALFLAAYPIYITEKLLVNLSGIGLLERYWRADNVWEFSIS